MVEKVDILGTEYKVEMRKYDEDHLFKDLNCNGYCDGPMRRIVIGDLTTFEENKIYGKDWIERVNKNILRHEIVHAFLYESGIDACGHSFAESWALNEEMVDWFAMQGSKIHDAWVKAEAI